MLQNDEELDDERYWLDLEIYARASQLQVRIGAEHEIWNMRLRGKDLRLILSTRALMVLALRSNVTSRTPKRCQSRSKRTRSPRAFPRPTPKQRVLVAGLICKNRDSQFICVSGTPLRLIISPESVPIPWLERIDDELELTV